MSLAPGLMGVAAAALVASAGIGGYVIGRSNAPTADMAEEARDLAFATASSEAAKLARASARDRGVDAGRAEGRGEGVKAGTVEGRGDARHEVEEQRTFAAEAAPTPSTDPYDYDLSTTAPPVDGECPAPLTYHMGICKLGRPALPEECPPGWVPAGLTGACGPARP